MHIMYTSNVATWITYSDGERECAGCSRIVGPGLVGWTDKLQGIGQPMCGCCLAGIDPRLVVAAGMDCESDCLPPDMRE